MLAVCSRNLLRRYVPTVRQLHRDVEEYFNCNGAIMAASIPDSFVGKSLRMNEPDKPIEIDLARRQHSKYVEAVRRIVDGNLVLVNPEEQYPDIVFVEEPAVIVDGVAVLTQMKPRSRAGEIHPMRKALEKHSEQLRVKSIRQMKKPGAYLDGGDVLFTGREFLVGLTERTNAVSIRKTCLCACSCSLAAMQYSYYASLSQLLY